MLYFFSTIARCDIDAQRDGLVLILSSAIALATVEPEPKDDLQQLIENYLEFHEAMPIRCSAVHICCDTTSNSMLSNVGLNLMKVFGDKTISTRVRLYEKDMSNDEIRNELAAFGIPVHELPVTPTGVIKHKQHNQWIKIQDWFERQDKQEQKAVQEQKQVNLLFLLEKSYIVNGLPLVVPCLNQTPFQSSLVSSSSFPLPPCKKQKRWTPENIVNDSSNIESNIPTDFEVTVIECPRVNDVLFRQGGKFWKGLHKFQRGNLEFMELIESKVKDYQRTRSWKKKHEILVEAVIDFARTSRGGRFLENATQLKGVNAPAGCWVELPLNSPLLLQKVRNTLINHVRRLESKEKRDLSSTTSSGKKKKAKKKIICVLSTKMLSSAIKPMTEKHVVSIDRKNACIHIQEVVQAIVVNDERLNKEVDELFRGGS